MIIVFTSRGYRYTHRNLHSRFGFKLPQFRTIHYEALFRARTIPRGTCVFADLERLAPYELRVASFYYRQLASRGIRCLNDPARAMARVELLHTLFEAGRNPIEVLRADTDTEPSRYPVFLRLEHGHSGPLSDVLESREQLTSALGALRDEGIGLRGVLIVGYVSEPLEPGLWAKWGTFRVGSNYSLDHIAVDGSWQVRRGDWDRLTPEVIELERDRVQANAFVEDLRPAFEVAHIEYGRADHGLIEGRPVLYEINTCPFIGKFVPDPHTVRRETQIIARQRLADAFEDINSTEGGRVRLQSSPLWKRASALQIGPLPPRRP